MSRIMELEEVLSSKVFIGDRSGVTFGSPRQYLEPFIEKFEKANLPVTYRVETADRTANKEADSDEINVSYGRVLIEAKLPENYTIHSHDSVIGLIYALDNTKPIIKIYSGEKAWACTNLAIFGAKYVQTIDIMAGYLGAYEKALEYITGATEQLAQFQKIYEKMNDTILESDDINRMIGFLLRESNKNKQIGTTPIVVAMKDLDDPKSKYAIRDGKTSQFNVYSAVTQYITDKVDILEKATKTQLISNLFVH